MVSTGYLVSWNECAVQNPKPFANIIMIVTHNSRTDNCPATCSYLFGPKDITWVGDITRPPGPNDKECYSQPEWPHWEPILPLVYPSHKVGDLYRSRWLWQLGRLTGMRWGWETFYAVAWKYRKQLHTDGVQEKRQHTPQWQRSVGAKIGFKRQWHVACLQRQPQSTWTRCCSQDRHSPYQEQD